MNSLKTVFLAALLSAATYGVYVTVTGQPPSEPPKEAAKDWEAGATVELPGGANSAGASPGQSAPPYVATSPADSGAAPPFAPAAPPGGSAPPFVAPPLGPADPEVAPADVAPLGEPTTHVDPPRYAPDEGILPPHAGVAPEAPVAPEAAVAPDDRYPPTDSPPPAPYPSTDRYAESGPSTLPAGYNEQPGPPASGGSEFETALAAVQASLDQGRFKEGLAALSEWYDHPRISTTEQAQLMDMLDRLAGTVIYSRQHLLESPYTIQPGDTLDRIADSYEVPWQLLAKINGVPDPQQLRTGDQLKVVRGPFDAVVDLSKFRLTLLLQGCYAGRFNIGVGQDLSTPEGEFSILNKVTNPTYYGRDVVIDPDDPANPLGERALDLGDHIWIHGTNEPQSIGRAESRGCIRLSPTDVEDVFDILSAKSDRSAGSRVTIRR